MSIGRSEVRARSRQLREEARALVARARAARALAASRRRQADMGERGPAGTCRRPREMTVEQAAERALLRQLTAVEIAHHTDLDPTSVLDAATRRARDEGRPVDDVLRDWFRTRVL
jgi:hypothetical protein